MSPQLGKLVTAFGDTVKAQILLFEQVLRAPQEQGAKKLPECRLAIEYSNKSFRFVSELLDLAYKEPTDLDKILRQCTPEMPTKSPVPYFVILDFSQLSKQDEKLIPVLWQQEQKYIAEYCQTVEKYLQIISAILEPALPANAPLTAARSRVQKVITDLQDAVQQVKPDNTLANNVYAMLYTSDLMNPKILFAELDGLQTLCLQANLSNFVTQTAAKIRSQPPATTKQTSAQRPPTNVQIVAYQKERDENAVKAIFQAFPHELYTWGGYTQDHLKNDAANCALVMRVNNETVGFVACRNFTNSKTNETNWCIRFLGIAPAHQGKGYGTQLIQAAENAVRSKGKRYIDITVVYSNTKAQALYKKLGYQIQQGKDPFHEVYLLRKDLTQAQ